MKKYINDDLRAQNKTAYDWLWLAQAVAVDYDGYRTEKGLMGLVDELAAYIREARSLLDKQRTEDIEEFIEELLKEINTIELCHASNNKEDILKQVVTKVNCIKEKMLGDQNEVI